MSAALFPLNATAQALPACPNPIADYGTKTPTEFYVGRPTDQLGSPFTFLNETDTCDTSPAAEWCDDNIAVVPAGTPEPNVELIPPLFLFFHGAGNRPSDHTHMANTAAYAGYPTIALSWDGSSDNSATDFTRQLTTSFLCEDTDVDHDNNSATDNVDLGGGECTDGCLYDLGVEMLTGADTTRSTPDSGMEYKPRPIRSVVQRTAMFLNDLYLYDVNSDTNNDYNWDQYCDYKANKTKIDWNNVVVGGFSMGANMASFISYTEGTHGLLAIEGGGDLCSDIDPGTFAVTAGLAEYYNTFAASSIQCGNGSCENRIMAFHESGPVWTGLTGLGVVPQLTVLGFQLDGTQIFLDGYLNAGTAIEFTYRLPANIMTTNQLPAPINSNAFHGSMAKNDQMPTEASNETAVSITQDANDYYLFPAYLEAMCWLK